MAAEDAAAALPRAAASWPPSPTGAIANLRGKPGMVLARVYVDHRESIDL